MRHNSLMAVSKRDREIFAKQVEFLRQHELPVGQEPTGEYRRSVLEWINKIRRADGSPEFVNDEDEVPELGFHRVAVARGMVTRGPGRPR